MKRKTQDLARIAIFSALIIVLQVIATFIKIGAFPITLTLIPIIVAGCVYGKKIGALMGFVFGMIVVIMVVTGLDPSGAAMLSYSPIATVGACLVKGVACGFVSALLFEKLYKKNFKLAVVVAALACPVTNTFVFYLFLLLFFKGLFAVSLGALLTFNFLIEIILDVVLAPGLTNLILHNKKRYE